MHYTKFCFSIFLFPFLLNSCVGTIWISPKSIASIYCPLWAFPFEILLKVFKMRLLGRGFLLKVFKMRLLGRGFHTLIKNVSFSSPTDVGSHNPPRFAAQRSRWHSFLSPIDVGPLDPPPLGPCVLPRTPPGVHLHSGLSLLASTSPGADFDTICNSPSPPLADIVLFGLSLLGFPTRFKTRLLGRDFHTLIKNVLFSSPTDVGSHSFEVS